MRYNKKLKTKVKQYIHHLRCLGMTWGEIEEHVKREYPEVNNICAFRKELAVDNRGGRVETTIDDKSLDAIAKAKADLLVNRKINVQMNRTLHNVANDNARWELIKEKLESWHPRHAFFHKDWIAKPMPTMKDVIYVVGDIHYRGVCDTAMVITTFEHIKWEVQQKNYQNVTLVLTGDNVDGEIHNEQTRTNEPVIDATLKFTDLLIDCIDQIPQINQVYMVYGNHEEIRLWGDKGTDNNIGKFIYWGLDHCLKYASVVAGSEFLFDYKGKKVLLLHGHQLYAKSKAGIIEHCSNEYKTQPDFIILGHFHTSKTNQFSKNHWLITAPALKNWASNYDKAHSYCGLGQYIKLKLNLDTPQITTINTPYED